MDTARPPPDRTLAEHEAFVRSLSRALLRDEAAAEDNAQDVWLAALERPPRHTRGLRGWLAVVTRRLAGRRWRTDARRDKRERAASRRVRLPSTDEVVERLDLQRHVLDHVQRLDEPYRTTVVLRYLHDLSPAEIAYAQAIPVETVKTRLGRALARLRLGMDGQSTARGEDWRLALLPAAFGRGLPVAGCATAGAQTFGVIVMANKKIVLALAALVLAAAAYLLFGGGWGDGDAESRSDVARRTTLAAEPPPSLRGRGPAIDEAGGDPPGTFRVVGVQGGGLHAGLSAVGRGSGLPAPGSSGNRDEPAPYRLAEASVDPSAAGLRVVVTRAGGRASATATLILQRYANRKTIPVASLQVEVPGSVDIAALPAGQVTLILRVGGAERRLGLRVVAGRVTELPVEFPEGASVEGVVRHLAQGRLVGVRVRLERKDEHWRYRLEAETDEEGNFRIPDTPPGEYAVQVAGGAAGTAYRHRGVLTVSGSETIVHDIVLGVPMLRGVIRDRLTGDPLPTVHIELHGNRYYMTAATDAHGAYLITDLPPGEYKISVHKEGYGSRTVETGAVERGRTRTLDFDLAPAAPLTLRVRDSAGHPVSGLVTLNLRRADGVSVVPPFLGLLCDADGVARYDGLPPAVYEVSFQADGCEQRRARVDLSGGGRTIDVVLERKGEGSVIVLSGTVRDAVTGDPIEGVLVRLLGALAVAHTNALGEYSFRDVKTSTIDLQVTRDGYAYRRISDVLAAAGVDRTLDILLDPAAGLVIHVTDRNGRPVSGLMLISARPREGQTGTRITTGATADATGRLVFERLAPGAYVLGLERENVGKAEWEAVLREGENRFDAVLE